MNDKDVIFVLGNPRTGSSALTRVLSLCGCSLPGEIVAAGPGNEKGFWEPIVATRLMLEFLIQDRDEMTQIQVHGRSFYNSAQGLALIEKIRAFLRGCSHQNALLVKEPLMCDFLEAWFGAARDEALSIKVVICVRHPNQTLSSLGIQDAVSLDAAAMRWLKVNLEVERHSRHLPRVFVEYGSLMKNWRTEVDRVSRALMVGLKPSEAEIESFLTPELFRNRMLDFIPSPLGHSWISQVYGAMSAAARDQPIGIDELDQIYELFRPHAPRLGVVPEELIANSYERSKNHPIWTSGRDF